MTSTLHELEKDIADVSAVVCESTAHLDLDVLGKAFDCFFLIKNDTSDELAVERVLETCRKKLIMTWQALTNLKSETYLQRNW